MRTESGRGATLLMSAIVVAVLLLVVAGVLGLMWILTR